MKEKLKSLTSSKKGMAIFFLLLASGLWGLQGITTRDLNAAGFDPIAMFALRSIVALVIFAAVMLIMDRKLFIIRKEHILFFVFFGLTKMVTDTLCFDSQMKLDLSLSSTLLATEPYFVAIISYFAFRERLSKIQVAAIFIAFFSCVVVSGALEGFKSVSAIGVLEGVAAGAVFGVYTVVLKHSTTMDYKPVTVLFYIFVVTTLVTIPFVDFGRLFSYIVTDATSIKNTFLFGVMYTVIPYYLQIVGIKHVSATIASVTMLFSIVVATIAGAVIYGEALTPVRIIGILVMLVTIIMLNKGEVRYENSKPAK